MCFRAKQKEKEKERAGKVQAAVVAPTTQEQMQGNQTLTLQGSASQQPQMTVQHSQQPQASQPYPMALPINVNIGGSQGTIKGCPMRGRWQGRRQPWDRWTSPEQGCAPQSPRGLQGPGYSQGFANRQNQQPDWYGRTGPRTMDK